MKKLYRLAAVLVLALGVAQAQQKGKTAPVQRTAIALSKSASKGDKAALAQLTTRANNGDAAAQLNLGNLYVKGEGVPKDAALAVSWYRKAADQGDADAQNSLGVQYYAGVGVPKDLVLSYMWRNLAAAQGHGVAKLVRDYMEKKMTPAEIAEAQKLSSEWKPTK